MELFDYKGGKVKGRNILKVTCLISSILCPFINPNKKINYYLLYFNIFFSKIQS